MKAEDTVIDLTDMGNYSLKIAMTSILKQQAEITWDKAIREVVGWIDKTCPHTGGLEEQQMRAMDCPRCWEDAEKEWGIE